MVLPIYTSFNNLERSNGASDEDVRAMPGSYKIIWKTKQLVNKKAENYNELSANEMVMFM